MVELEEDHVDIAVGESSSDRLGSVQRRQRHNLVHSPNSILAEEVQGTVRPGERPIGFGAHAGAAHVREQRATDTPLDAFAVNAALQCGEVLRDLFRRLLVHVKIS